MVSRCTLNKTQQLTLVSILHWPHLLPLFLFFHETQAMLILYFFKKWALTVCTGLSTFHVLSHVIRPTTLWGRVVSMLETLKVKHDRLRNSPRVTPLAAGRAGVQSPCSQPVYHELPSSRPRHLCSHSGSWRLALPDGMLFASSSQACLLFIRSQLKPHLPRENSPDCWT